MSGFFSRLLGALASLTLLASVDAILTISQKGSKFFTSDGNQWYIKGVAYQLIGTDLGTDGGQCARDAALMQQLGANTIRVYHVDPSLDHDACMQAFEDAGIYVFVDLDTFSSTVTQGNPTWTPAQYGAFKFVMDAFQKYDNVAGFFIGNEVVNSVGSPTAAMAYVKAATADMKAYRNAMGYRQPIGYSHADVAGLRPILQDYLACGDPTQAIDFFGLNAYEWCGASSYVQSGYEVLYEQTEQYPVPIFMSETGCNQPEPRLFTDQNAIFTNMSNVWSGSIIYEWIQESNHYGLIAYAGDTNGLIPDNPGDVRSGTPMPVTPDFPNLQAQWATLHPTGVQEAAYVPTNPPMACPAYTAGVWEVDPNAALPTLGLGVAIPTASALALANNGLSSWTTPPALAAPAPAAVSTTPASPTPASTTQAPAPPPSTSSTPPPAIVAPPPASFSDPPASPPASSSPAQASSAPASNSATASSTPAPTTTSTTPSSTPASSTTPSSAVSAVSSASSSAASIRSSLQSSAASVASAVSSGGPTPVGGGVVAASTGSTSPAASPAGTTTITTAIAASGSTHAQALPSSTSTAAPAAASSSGAATPSGGVDRIVLAVAGVVGAAAFAL